MNFFVNEKKKVFELDISLGGDADLGGDSKEKKDSKKNKEKDPIDKIKDKEKKKKEKKEEKREGKIESTIKDIKKILDEMGQEMPENWEKWIKKDDDLYFRVIINQIIKKRKNPNHIKYWDSIIKKIENIMINENKNNLDMEFLFENFIFENFIKEFEEQFLFESIESINKAREAIKEKANKRQQRDSEIKMKITNLNTKIAETENAEKKLKLQIDIEILRTQLEILQLEAQIDSKKLQILDLRAKKIK